ncbi:MAG: helix-turn-helix domain-containing protein, partial [Candidatus Thorarchaeota archaeon]
MSEQSVIQKISGLDDSEMQVYSLVLSTGNVTTGDIALMSNMDLDEVERIITSLERKGLLIALSGIVPRFQAVAPFEDLAKELQEVGQKIERAREDLRKQVQEASSRVREALVETIDRAVGELHTHTEHVESDKSSASNLFRSAIDEQVGSLERSRNEIAGQAEAALGAWRAELPQVVDPGVADIKNSVSSAASGLSAEIRSWSSSAKGIVGDLSNSLRSTIDGFNERVVSAIEGQKGVIEESVSGQLEQAVGAVNHAKTGVVEALDQLKTDSANITDTLIAEIKNTIGDVRAGLEQTVQETTNSIKENVEAFGSEISGAMVELREATGQSISAHRTNSAEALAALLRDQSAALEQFHTGLDSTMTSLTNSVSSASLALKDQVNGFATRAGKTLESAVESMSSIAEEAGNALFDSSGAAVNTMTTSVKEGLTDLQQQIESVLRETAGHLSELKRESLSATTQLMDNTRGAVGHELRALAEEMGDRIASHAQQVTQEVKDLSDRLIQQIQTMVEQAGERLQSFAQSATEEIGQVIENQLSRVEQEFGGHLDTYRVKHDEMSRRINDAVNESIAQQSRAVAGMKQSIDVFRDQLQERLDSLRTQTTDNVRARQQEIVTATKHTVEKMLEDTSTILESMSSSLTDATTSAANDAKSLSSDLERLAHTATDAIRNDMESTIGSLSAAVDESVNRATERARGIVDGTTQDLEEKTTALSASMLSTL